jgi:hypothetical protein
MSSAGQISPKFSGRSAKNSFKHPIELRVRLGASIIARFAPSIARDIALGAASSNSAAGSGIGVRF